MTSQRACVAEKQVRYRSSNGPLRVQSNGKWCPEYSATRKTCVSCRGYGSIPQSARAVPWNQGGTADDMIRCVVCDSSLTEELFCQGRFLFLAGLHSSICLEE